MAVHVQTKMESVSAEQRVAEHRQDFVLTCSCVNQPGITTQTTNAITLSLGDISEAQQFNDAITGRFFMRVEFGLMGAEAELCRRLAEVAERFDMKWELAAKTERPNILIMVSKFDHCLVDLLYRHRNGELSCHIVGIVSNHAQDIAVNGDIGDIPFFHLPVTPETKAQQETALLDLIDKTGADLVVLARYMQILSNELSAKLANRCINIHHSFLPSFKGAKPYHQAHARGVKMIGATAHYVTADLDEGPIIAQDVEAISHSDSPDDLVAKGRDIERRVLSRAVALHLERRVFLNGARSVVFRK